MNGGGKPHFRAPALKYVQVLVVGGVNPKEYESLWIIMPNRENRPVSGGVHPLQVVNI